MSKRTEATSVAPRLLTIKQVGEAVGCTPRTIQRLVHKGGFPRPLRLGDKLIRWSAAALDTWIAKEQQAIEKEA